MGIETNYKMKELKHIYISLSGEPRACTMEVPEEPDYCTDIGDIILTCDNTFCVCDGKLKRHRSDIERVISTAIPIENKNVLPNIPLVEYLEIINGDGRLYGRFYPISGYRYEVKEVDTIADGGGCFVAGSKNVAIVSPIEESLFDKALSQVPNDIKESVDKDFLIINLQKESIKVMVNSLKD